MATALEKALAKQYSQKKKKKKNNEKKVGGAYGGLLEKQNKQKEAYAKKVASEKKKEKTPLEKAINKSAKAEQKSTKTVSKSTNKTTTKTWGDIVKEQNRQRQKQGQEVAKRKAEAEKRKEVREKRESINPYKTKSWTELQEFRRKNRSNETALGTYKKTNTLTYGGESDLTKAIGKPYETDKHTAQQKRNKAFETMAKIQEPSSGADRILLEATADKIANDAVTQFEKENNIKLDPLRRGRAVHDIKSKMDLDTEFKTSRKENAQKIARDFEKKMDAKKEAKTFTYEDLSRDEMNALITANTAFPGNVRAQNDYLRSVGGEKLLRKVGDINAASMYKGAGAAGFMEGASLIPVYDTLSGEYSDEARDVMQAAKEKSAYTVGNLAGMGAQFAVGGTNTLAESLLGKALPKLSSKAGKFLARRGAEMLTESGVDISDAYKQAIDREGNIDWDKFQKNIIMNVGLNVGMGIGMDTASTLMTRWNANRLFKLENKQALGTITDKELIELGQIRSKLLEKADDTMSAGSDVAKQTLEESNANRLARQTDVPTNTIDNTVNEQVKLEDIDNSVNTPKQNISKTSMSSNITNAPAKKVEKIDEKTLKGNDLYADVKDVEGYNIGDVVKHDKYGEGIVIGNPEKELEIRFKNGKTYRVKEDILEDKKVRGEGDEEIVIGGEWKPNPELSLVSKTDGMIEVNVDGKAYTGKLKGLFFDDFDDLEGVAVEFADGIRKVSPSDANVPQSKINAFLGKKSDDIIDTTSKEVKSTNSAESPNKGDSSTVKAEDKSETGGKAETEGTPNTAEEKIDKIQKETKERLKEPSQDEKLKAKYEGQRNTLRKQRDNLAKKVNRLKKKIETETDVNKKAQFNKELKKTQTELSKVKGTIGELDTQIKDIDKRIKAENPSKVVSPETAKKKAKAKAEPKKTETEGKNGNNKQGETKAKDTKKAETNAKSDENAKKKNTAQNETNNSKTKQKNTSNAERDEYEAALGKDKYTKAESKEIQDGVQKLTGKVRFEQEEEALKIAKEIAKKHGNGNVDEIAENIVRIAKERHEKKLNQAISKAKKKLKDMDANAFNKAVEELSEATTSVHLKQILKSIAEELDPESKWIMLEGLEDTKTWFGKIKGVSQADAKKMAEEEFDKYGLDKLYNDYIDIKVGATGIAGQDIHVVQAKGSLVLHEILRQLNAGEGDLAELTNKMYKVIAKSCEISSTSGRVLNAAKMMLWKTPAGRLTVFMREKDRLYEMFKHRIKGDTLEVPDELVQKLGQELTEEELDKTLKELNRVMWAQIPATQLEKINAWRRVAMLANFRTHARNVTGNAAFAMARGISDALEYGIINHGPFAKMIKDSGNKAVMGQRITKADKEAYASIKEWFFKQYNQSDSQHRLAETQRPADAAIWNENGKFKLTRGAAKAANWTNTKNFDLLDKEDVNLFMAHAFTKQFVKYCKAYGYDFKNIDNMAKGELKKATDYAFGEAQKVCYRNATALSNWITKTKQTLESYHSDSTTKNLMAKAGNIAFESVIPFVKTPINLFLRGLDYSPASLVRAGATISKALKKGDVDNVLAGIHQLSTGLTGTGIFALGMFAYEQGWVTVEAGNVSRDQYYDREMGYQDYSINICGYSLSIDWLSPLQNSFFMGAAVMEKQEADGFSFNNTLDVFAAMVDPVLEMSFMSSAKDTAEAFMKIAGKGDGEYPGEDWMGAIANTICGKLPQGWAGSMIPQVLAQSANVFDKYQRDTRSTKENVLAKSWESFFRQQANKVPFIRNTVLNPKVDRRGRDMTTGQNVFTKAFNYFMNPAKVKKITLDDFDREVIKNGEHLEGDDLSKYYMRETGNPFYDLYGEDNKRMSYEDLYKYGKEQRTQKTEHYKNMFAAKSYKYMTPDQKVEEMAAYNEIATAQADLKIYGADYALKKNVLDEKWGKPNAAEAWDNYQKAGGNSKNFMNSFVEIEKFMARAGATTKDFNALAVATAKLNDATKIAQAYDIHKDKIELANIYFKKGGSATEYTDSMCRVNAILKNAGVDASDKTKARAMADFYNPERVYRTMGYTWNKAQAAAGLKKYGYTFKEGFSSDPNLPGFYTKHTFDWIDTESKKFNEDGSGVIKKDEAVKFINSFATDLDEKACLFEYLKPGAKNPFKEQIADHLKWGKNRDDEWGTESKGTSKGKSYGRRSYGRRSYSRKGSSSGSSSTSTVSGEDWRKFLDEKRAKLPTTTSSTGKVPTIRQGDEWKDVINTAYKNKVRKIRKESIKK